MRRTKIFQKFKLFCSEATNNEMPLSYDKSKSGKFHLTQAKFSTICDKLIYGDSGCSHRERSMRRTKIFQKFKLFYSEATNNEMPLSYDNSKSGKFHLTQAKFSTPPPPPLPPYQEILIIALPTNSCTSPCKPIYE